MRAHLALLCLLVAGCDLLAFEPFGRRNCSSSGPVTQVAGNLSPPRWIAVQSGWVYYTSPNGNTVARVRTTGFGQPEVFCCGQESPHRIAVSGPYAWFTTSLGGVHRLDLTLVTPTDQRIVPAGAVSNGIAFSSSNIYWTLFDGRVMQAGLDGSNPLEIANGQGISTTIRAGSDAVYWLPAVGQPWLQRFPFPSGPVQSLSVGDSIAFSVGGDIAIDGSDIYWTDPDQGAVLHIGTDGTRYYHQIDSQGRPTGIALDATYVYWTNDDDGTVIRMPRAGGSQPQTIASCQDQPFGIAVDNGRVYWAAQGNSAIMAWSPQ